MRRGREEKEPNETNDDYRLINEGEPPARDVAPFPDSPTRAKETKFQV